MKSFVLMATLLGSLSVARADVAPIVEAPAEDDGGGGGDTTWCDVADAPSDGAKAGDVLDHVYWEGHGFTTVVADYYFYRQ